MEQKSAFETFELEVGEDIKKLLKETASWTYFLSILGFVGIGFMVVFGLFFGAFMGSGLLGDSNPYAAMGFSMAYLGLVYVVIALIYFLPVYYLFNFSRKMKSALKATNNTDFKLAFTSLKSHYKFVGIFAIIIFSLYLLVILGSLFATLLF